MRILLTGASGVVGERFLSLAPGEWDVVCLGRSVVKKNREWVRCDLSDRKECEGAAKKLQAEQFDILLHLAAFVPKTAEEDILEDAVSGNIIASTNLLKYFGTQCSKLTIGSTIEVYDQAGVTGDITENNPVGPASYYGATKLSSDLLAQSYARKNNKELTILRFSVMYGVYDPISRALPNFIRAAKTNNTIYVRGARVRRDYIHLDDVVQSIIAAINNPGAGVVNIGTGRGVTIREAVESVIKVMDSSSEVSIEQEEGGADIVIDITKASTLLGYRPSVYFPDKLREMTEYYHEG